MALQLRLLPKRQQQRLEVEHKSPKHRLLWLLLLHERFQIPANSNAPGQLSWAKRRRQFLFHNPKLVCYGTFLVCRWNLVQSPLCWHSDVNLAVLLDIIQDSHYSFGLMEVSNHLKSKIINLMQLNQCLTI